ncbi:MAG: DUF4156 domain-containing protein [Myxococcota bacterium]
MIGLHRMDSACASSLRKTLRCSALLVLASLHLGCTWVALVPEAEGVRVLEARQADQCTSLGTTTSSVLTKAGPFDRSPSKVRGELETVARNEAARMGGDAIVPVAAVENGKRTFAVYRCAGP